MARSDLVEVAAVARAAPIGPAILYRYRPVGSFFGYQARPPLGDYLRLNEGRKPKRQRIQVSSLTLLTRLAAESLWR